VRVPTHLFKLVYDAGSGRAWAHWIANTNEARVGRPISYGELVKRTGITFLPGVQPGS
jgi:endonuclease G